jgi:hypothetical protein
MTGAPDDNSYKRKHYTLDEDTLEILETYSDNHHNGNDSEAVRSSIRFRDRWQTREKSLPNEIIHSLDQISSAIEELEEVVDGLAERVEDMEQTTSGEPAENVGRARQKRQIRSALSKDEGRRIDTVAEQVGLPLGDAIAAAEELEDNDRIVRTTSEEEEVRFKRLK